MFKTIGSFFGRIFGSPQNTTQTLDMIRDGVDAAFLTKEEKIQYTQKGVEMFLEFVKLANSGPDIARRFIAISITVVWLICVITCLVTGLLSFWFAAAAGIYGVLFTLTTELVLPSWGAVMLFYFGKGILERKG